MFYIKKDSTNRAWEKQLVKGDGTPIDLTEAQEVRFIMKDSYGVEKINSLATAFGDLTLGQIQYSWVTGDTDTAGLFYAEVHILFADGKIEIAPSKGYEHIQIEEDLRA